MKKEKSTYQELENKILILTNELLLVNKEIFFQNKEKANRADELLIANKELVFQNTEKAKRAAELTIANKEIFFQKEEKANRANELIVANKELTYQNKEKANRADELIIANKELVFQNTEKAKRAAELIIANILKEETEKWTTELIIAKEKIEESERSLKTINEAYLAINEELNQNNEELFTAKEKAEESDKLKTSFLQNMSHEIRTPLNAILGFSELLIRQNVDEKEKETLSKYIRMNGESLAKIIDDIIDISKLQSKQLTITKGSFNLNILINELYNYYSSLLIQKSKSHIELVMDLPEVLKTDFYIESDEQRLKQILNNLLSNAVKYTVKGKITFGYKIEENKLHFFVKDTGFGIAPENIEQIFERFVQISPQYASKQEGTGLGLAICKNLVDLLGGELQLESEVNKGSRFYFNLPLTRSKSAKSKNTNMKADDVDYDFSSCKILIADDEESNYVLTKRLLEDTNIKMDWAQNGLHAVKMATQTNYDLIIMDIKMPEMDGIEATKQIRTVNKDIPILMQTAFAMDEAKEEALMAGCNDFIVKPISLNVFLELVNKHLSNNKKSQR